VQYYEDKLQRRDTLISESNSMGMGLDKQNRSYELEIRTLKSYIVDLKAMIKMLLNPEGIPALSKA
jgi:hypothetical protein